MRLPFLQRPQPPKVSPYFQGYLAATRQKTAVVGTRGLINLPDRIYGEGSDADVAYSEGIADSVVDRAPRQARDRVSRAYPKWRLI